ncbi:MAG: T9SS type A sorting domain-containing protein [Flavobacteriales bacterium]|nr:T9SS type A sorting domain-containing protein [Flavobacteriales bacterium]
MINLSKITFFFSCAVFAQFSPIIGEEGCIAIHMDSPLFTSWAEKGELERGWMNIADTTLGKVTFGEIDFAYGAPDPAVLSLGDGGSATFFFQETLFDGEGYDFAVFENAFDNYFLELAFVEVSSDGEHFFRFESQSVTSREAQLGSFDLLATEKLHNLAGKYPAQWGTPFDLNEMKDHPGLDIYAISHIRIIDVVGSVDPLYATYDSYGRTINDPWPTAFEQGGFDLDAIGVMHQNPLSIEEHSEVFIYPNPVSMESSLLFNSPYPIENVKLIDALGRVQNIDFSTEIYLSQYVHREGLYVLEYEVLGEKNRQKLIVR